MSEQIVWAFLAGAALGGYLALAIALHIMERRARRYKEAALNLTVTPEVMSQINSQIIMQWLDANGYCWMPKGQEFKWPKEVRR